MKKLVILVMVLIMAVSCTVAMVGCNKGIEIGVQSGTTGQYYVEDYKNLTAKGFNSAGLAIADMKNGGVQYVIVDIAPAKALVSKIEGIKYVNIPLTEEEYAFGVNKNDAELLSKVNEQLAVLKTNGVLDAIFAKYATEDASITGIESAAYDASKNQLVVATNAEFAPFEYMIGDKFAGIDIEIAKYLADALSMELVISNMDFDSVVSSTGSNGIDIAMAGLTVTEERKASVVFTDSYYNAAQVVVCLEGDTTFDNCTTKADVEAILAGLK